MLYINTFRSVGLLIKQSKIMLFYPWKCHGIYLIHKSSGTERDGHVYYAIIFAVEHS
jgi:hypothetical protein